MKKFLKVFGLSVFSTVIILIILIFTRDYFLNYILAVIKNLKGTSHYQGETKAADFLNIMTYIITPTVFTLSFFIILFKFNKPKIK